MAQIKTNKYKFHIHLYIKVLFVIKNKLNKIDLVLLAEEEALESQVILRIIQNPCLNLLKNILYLI